ncbi:MAG: hypothetical protein HYU78_11730 [Rhodocyclales bacterium]|nr:hypothetical protein [Rhodocyclales bacterium]
MLWLQVSNYFETPAELFSALGLRDSRLLSVDEFSDEQIANFLNRFPSKHSGKPLPEWLPTRPLLLGYLASKGLLEDLSSSENLPDAVDGWDYLLERIYQREERIESNLDGATLRRILERVATLARNASDQLGPITRTELFSAFSEVCGYEPDEQGVLAIQRLPGLGMYRAEDESRCFVDKELVGVCTGRELLNFIESPYEAVKNKLWVDTMNSCDSAIGPVGAEYCSRKLRAAGDARGALRQTITFLNSRSDIQCAKADISAVMLTANIELDLNFNIEEISFSNLPIEFVSDTSDYGKLQFSHCFFSEIHLESGIDQKRLPVFSGCMFDRVSGRISVADLPSTNFHSGCEFSAFDEAGSSVAIRAGQSSTPEKVLLITLRKLYIQSLSGRIESALHRGLDVDERRYVNDILRLLKRHGLATDYSKGNGVIWLPVRKALERVKRILIAPAECGEKLIAEARAL